MRNGTGSTAVASSAHRRGDMGNQVVVQRVIAAPALVVWSLVSDITRMGEWSPEATGGRWLHGASGPAAGARFEGTNRIGERRWSRICKVVEAEPGYSFAFDVAVGPFTVARWQYRFEPSDAGCVASEIWTDRRSWLVRKYSKIRGIPDRSAHNRKTMTVTLDRLAAAAEASAAS